MKKSIENLIEKFLAEPRRSSAGGGWAEITPDDIQVLDRIIDTLVKAKCDPDADGDRPIEWKLINRRTHNRLNFFSLPYPKDEVLSTRKSINSYLRLATSNLRMATNDISQVSDTLDILIRHETQANN